MSEIQFGEPFEAVGSPLLDSVAKLDDQQRLLVGLMHSIISEQPDMDQCSAIVSQHVHDQATYFTDASLEIYDLYNHESTDAVTAAIAQLWLLDDVSRGEDFNEMTGTEEFESFDYDRVLSIVEASFAEASNITELGEALYDRYARNLSVDLQSLINRCYNRSMPERSEPWLVIQVDTERIKEKLESSAVIGTGIAIGGLLLRHIVRRFR